MDSNDGGSARLAVDGVTIVRHRYGQAGGGVCYAAVEELHPGDPGYDELLPAARQNAIADRQSDAPANPGTLARILRDAGLDESNLGEK